MESRSVTEIEFSSPEGKLLTLLVVSQPDHNLSPIGGWISLPRQCPATDIGELTSG